MEIVINHLTRMEKGYLCVAGIRTEDQSHIRPVIPGRRLPISLAADHGGPLDIRGVVELGDVQRCGAPPLIEDVQFEPARLAKIAHLERAAFWRLLTGIAGFRLREIFGNDLQQHGGSLSMPINMGIASLGCLFPATSPQLWVNKWNKIRLSVDDTEGHYDLSVTDLRLHNSEDNTPNMDIVGKLQAKLWNGSRCVLSVGLTKAWTKPRDDQARHWLQVNGIHFEDD